MTSEVVATRSPSLIEGYDPSDDLDRMQRELLEQNELIELLETYLAGAITLSRFLKRQQENRGRVIRKAVQVEERK